MAAQVEAGGTLVRMAAQAWMWEAWMREAAASERRRLCGTLGTRARRRLVWLGASRLTRALEGGRRTCSLRAVSVATNCMIARFTPDTATTLQTGGGGAQKKQEAKGSGHGCKSHIFGEVVYTLVSQPPDYYGGSCKKQATHCSSA
jgi:hypothetical protein